MIPGINKDNAALIGAGITAVSTVAHGIYANKFATAAKDSPKNFAITNALASLSVMLGMVAKTSSLGWGVRAFSVLSSGAATMIPTVWRVATLRAEALAKAEIKKN
jgi:hypothetical protein